MNESFKLSIQCLTYNHSSSIVEAMNGFVMQQTYFKYVACIVDDASTDGEQEIIKSYLYNNFQISDGSDSKLYETDYAHVYFVQHNKNKNCYFLVMLLKSNHYQKGLIHKMREYIYPWTSACVYQAMCEGDDYWIDPFKLQKQVQILDNNSDIYLCGSNGFIHYDGLFKEPRYFNHIKESKQLTPEEVIPHWVFPTASLVYRFELLKNYPDWTKKIYSGDQTRILLALYYGGVYALSDITCVYRKTKSETSASNSARKKSRNFVTDQHIILYQEFDKFTDGKYKSIIDPHLKQLKKRSKVYRVMNRSTILSFFVDPVTFWNIVKKRLPWNTSLS